MVGGISIIARPLQNHNVPLHTPDLSEIKESAAMLFRFQYVKFCGGVPSWI